MTDAKLITLSEALGWLAEQRVTPKRNAYDTVRYGEWILDNNELSALGDEHWAFLEQVGLAAAELGKYELADLCLSRLSTRFPDSPRVVLFQGTVLESKGLLREAQHLYETFLRIEPVHMLINKRRIAAIRAQPDGVADATEALAEFVDHFPLDQESWQELASLYTEQNKYAQAAYALEELLLLAPHNSYYLLQYAETLYTMGEIAKAYKIYLRILELGEGNMKPKSGRASDRVSGPWVRTLWGLKVCTTQLLAHSDKRTSTDGEVTAEKVPEIDTLVTQLMLENVYAPDAQDAAPAAVRAAARKSVAHA
ncbi:TPR-like protein [Malassezia japonica]|uniref:ER membrane protein complex subunit 2 n=1 Tax=Malassezia japonica TaxID=223818 RepID=A0AAF0JAW6_9BASI|nr:TPR-like protein [Malassezia japonica]WFD39269.1 TPR-like protein [Malassezia japonica]